MCKRERERERESTEPFRNPHAKGNITDQLFYCLLPAKGTVSKLCCFLSKKMSTLILFRVDPFQKGLVCIKETNIAKVFIVKN